SSLRGPRGVASDRFSPPPPTSAETITPAQVIEGALFVGGGPLSAGKLYALLRGTIALEDVPELIDDLNHLYASQNRPYEIRLGDGGYVLDLCPDYEKLRHRVFGQGPREVRLTQDQLEVLALVAYRQPISEAGIAALGRPEAGNVLRHLLRRELVSLERGEQGPKDVTYHTTERFLSVFGLASLAELPQPEDLAAR
ncbi:MAG: SMC-Scp complex subunit ScpB, partial [Planctomycetaceae bacterium]